MFYILASASTSFPNLVKVSEPTPLDHTLLNQISEWKQAYEKSSTTWDPFVIGTLKNKINKIFRILNTDEKKLLHFLHGDISLSKEEYDAYQKIFQLYIKKMEQWANTMCFFKDENFKMNVIQKDKQRLLEMLFRLISALEQQQLKLYDEPISQYHRKINSLMGSAHTLLKKILWDPSQKRQRVDEKEKDLKRYNDLSEKYLRLKDKLEKSCDLEDNVFSILKKVQSSTQSFYKKNRIKDKTKSVKFPDINLKK